MDHTVCLLSTRGLLPNLALGNVAMSMGTAYKHLRGPAVHFLGGISPGLELLQAAIPKTKLFKSVIRKAALGQSFPAG